MNKLGKLMLLGVTSTVAATPVLAHGGHGAVGASAHESLHLLMALGGAIATAVLAYLLARTARRKAERA